MSLECLGDKRGIKLIFWTLLIIIVKLSYLIAIQYVSLRLLLKIINLYRIRQHVDYQCVDQLLLADAKYFFNAYPQPCKYLKHSILQSFIEGQKFVRGDRQGTAFLQRNP